MRQPRVMFRPDKQSDRSSPQGSGVAWEAASYGEHRFAPRLYAATLIFVLAVILTVISGCSGGVVSPQQSESSDAGLSQSKEPSPDSSPASSQSSVQVSSSSSSSVPIHDVVGKMQVSGVVLDQDSTGRYFVKGTVTNSASDVYDVSFNLKLTINEVDKSGKDYSTKESVTDAQTDTPWLSFNNGSFTALNIGGGESREFTVYPVKTGKHKLNAKNVTADSPELSVSKAVVTPTHQGLKNVPDFDGNLVLDVLSFNGKRISGSLVNNTGKYVSAANLRFVKYDSENLPIADSNAGDRPVGVKVISQTLENIEPNGSVDFDIKLGECADYRLRDVFYDVNQAKS